MEENSLNNAFAKKMRERFEAHYSPELRAYAMRVIERVPRVLGRVDIIDTGELRPSIDWARVSNNVSFRECIANTEERQASFGIDSMNRRFIGNPNCINNALSPHLQCAVNPTGDCSECPHFEQIQEVEEVEVRDVESTSCPEIRMYIQENCSIGGRANAPLVPRQSLHLILSDRQRQDLITMLSTHSGDCEIILNGEEMRVQ